MLQNTNISHRVEDNSEVVPKYIVIDVFTALNKEHVLEIQPFCFIEIEKYYLSDWRDSASRTNEMPFGKTYSIPYNPIPSGVPDFNALQTMWYVYEQLRLKLLAENPTWDETKIINLVPKGELS